MMFVFADASFSFTDGPQRGELVRDARHEKQLSLRLTGLDISCCPKCGGTLIAGPLPLPERPP